MSVARAHGALLFVAFAAGCGIRGDGIEESVSSNVAALNIPDDLPKPVQWDGSRIELFVADAWAACSAVADENTPSPTDVCSIIPAASHDLYMESVRQLMDTSATACQSLSPGYTVDENNCFFTPLANGNTLRHWVWTRKNADCNSFATSAGTSPKAAPLALERMPGVLSVIPFGPSQNTLEADDIVRTPGVNLCIAQRLRHLAPGTAGAATLTLSAADQRELLSITRDRAQMSILGYTRLARLLATKQPAVPPTTSLELAQDWFNNAAGPEFPTELGDDFAAAIQIHTLATTELLDLLARSASANVPWGAPSNTDSITLQFATGSWRDRALSLLYGGDPLAATTVATPWQHFPGTVPNVVNDTTVDHAAVDVREPQVDQLFQVLRRFDSIDLREAPNKRESTR